MPSPPRQDTEESPRRRREGLRTPAREQPSPAPSAASRTPTRTPRREVTSPAKSVASSRSSDRHSKSKEHLASQCKIKLFGKQNIATSIDSALKTAIISYNNQVRENRNNLKKLIDITIYLAGQDLAFRGHNESSESYNRGNYKELSSGYLKFAPKVRIKL
nr:unnamed protein product [Callosobruchus analis]